MKNAAIGSHCILELTGCPSELLADETRIREAIVKASQKTLSTLLSVSSHKLEPGASAGGVTALGLLAESHISIHTWPHLGYAACDILTFGQSTRPTQACDFLAAYMQARGHSLKLLPRGRRLAEATA